MSRVTVTTWPVITRPICNELLISTNKATCLYNFLVHLVWSNRPTIALFGNLNWLHDIWAKDLAYERNQISSSYVLALSFRGYFSIDCFIKKVINCDVSIDSWLYSKIHAVSRLQYTQGPLHKVAQSRISIFSLFLSDTCRINNFMFASGSDLFINILSEIGNQFDINVMYVLEKWCKAWPFKSRFIKSP